MKEKTPTAGKLPVDFGGEGWFFIVVFPDI